MEIEGVIGVSATGRPAGPAPGSPRPPRRLPANAEIAFVLDRVAALLEVQGTNPYRVRAYRRAAHSVREAGASVAELAVAAPMGELERLPGVGRSIGSAIREYASSGWLAMLERLEGQVSPEDLFASVPGIGDQLARRLHAHLHIDTLEELELAAHDGRLEQVDGFGPRRAEALREILGGLLSRSSRRWSRMVEMQPADAATRPPVDLLLRVDADYRGKAAAGELRTITPRRFNPERRAWLPILHTEVGGWALTALFSNTARAHDLGMTRDWVIVYYEQNGDEGQATIVTERHGLLAGRRVVRGREAECGARFDAAAAPSSSRRSRTPFSEPSRRTARHHRPAGITPLQPFGWSRSCT